MCIFGWSWLKIRIVWNLIILLPITFDITRASTLEVLILMVVSLDVLLVTSGFWPRYAPTLLFRVIKTQNRALRAHPHTHIAVSLGTFHLWAPLHANHSYIGASHLCCSLLEASHLSSLIRQVNHSQIVRQSSLSSFFHPSSQPFLAQSQPFLSARSKHTNWRANKLLSYSWIEGRKWKDSFPNYRNYHLALRGSFII
jgi:hypothetical protein